MQRLPDDRQRWRQRYTGTWLGICAVVGLIELYIYVALARWPLFLYLGLMFLAVPIGYLALRAAWHWMQTEWSQGTQAGSGQLVIGVSAERPQLPAYWHHRQREAPTLILGGTRLGKSSLQASLSGQDIRRGETVVVVDPHRDLALQLLPACVEAGRDVVWFEPGDPDRVPAYNPLEVRDGWSPLSRAKMLVDAMKRAWFPFSGEIPMRITSSVSHAAHLLAANDYTLLELPRLLLQENFRNSLAEQVRDAGLREWLGWFNSLTAHQRYEQVTSSLIRLNQLVHDPETALVLGQQHSTVSLTEAIEQNRVLLAALTAARLQSAAYLLGSLLATDLIYTLMRRLTRPFEERQRVYVVFDEFDQIVPESARDFISQAGKAGCSLTLIGQARGMIDPRLRDTVLANCTNRIIFGISGPEAMEIAQEIFEPDPRLVKQMTGDQRPIFYTPQEQWAFYAARLQALPPHSYLTVTPEGKEPRYMKLPSFQPAPAERLEAMRRAVLPRYTRPRQEAEEELRRRRMELDRRFGPLAEDLPPAPGEEPVGPREHAPF
ncbi:MAG: hypothetical protein IMY86_09445 [Chloroflexi bacterium]|nr:hypothetical protein [Chloroflexota bacterium]